MLKIDAHADALLPGLTEAPAWPTLRSHLALIALNEHNPLDVLNAEQELLNSQVALVTARRDQYVAGFQLLNAMGQAEADDLGLDGGPLYDPTGNYRRVAGNWNDWAGEKQTAPRSTSTVRPEEQPQGVTPAAR